MTAFETATGKTFQTDYIVPHEPSHSLYIRILNSDFPTVASVFSDPEETTVLTYGGITFTGFTYLNSIEQEIDALKVRLKQHE